MGQKSAASRDMHATKASSSIAIFCFFVTCASCFIENEVRRLEKVKRLVALDQMRKALSDCTQYCSLYLFLTAQGFMFYLSDLLPADCTSSDSSEISQVVCF